MIIIITITCILLFACKRTSCISWPRDFWCKPRPWQHEPPNEPSDGQKCTQFESIKFVTGRFFVCYRCRSRPRTYQRPCRAKLATRRAQVDIWGPPCPVSLSKTKCRLQIYIWGSLPQGPPDINSQPGFLYLGSPGRGPNYESFGATMSGSPPERPPDINFQPGF